MSVFKQPTQGYGNRKAGTLNENDLQTYNMRSYPQRGRPTQRCRYREFGKNLFEVEVWLENMVAGKGVMGRARSVLVARYYITRTGTGTNTAYQKTGKAEVWHFNGNRKDIYEFKPKRGDEEVELYHAEFNSQGQLIEFMDRRRGEDNQRLVRYRYYERERQLLQWRGRYHERTQVSTYGVRTEEYTVRRHPLGEPLKDKGDYIVKTYNKDDIMIAEESYEAGEKHGFERDYNRFGRVIAEQYWHRGAEIPEWVYLDPKGVTAEEIQDEEDEKVRAAMLELQGPELYQVRAMARSMRAIARTRIAESTEVDSALVLVKRPVPDVA